VKTLPATAKIGASIFYPGERFDGHDPRYVQRNYGGVHHRFRYQNHSDSTNRCNRWHGAVVTPSRTLKNNVSFRIAPTR
jgi:hypothetical protein